MKLLRIFGVVVGVHVFALMLIFANPGCSSTNKPPASSNESAAGNDGGSSAASSPDASSLEPSPVSAAPAYGATPGDNGTSAGVRFSPTRPGTPAAGALETQPVTDVTPASTYTVAPGDSLWTIARRNHISVAELAAANNIRQNAVVQIGQRLIIPAKAVAGSSMSVTDPVAARAATPAPAAARAPRETVKHVVRSGETLGGIARKYQVKVGEIATANNIADPAKIRPGMELTIPGWQAPASRSATASPAPATPAAPVERATSTIAPSEQPAAEVPTLVIPPPDEESAEEAPPVIRVDDTP